MGIKKSDLADLVLKTQFWNMDHLRRKAEFFKWLTFYLIGFCVASSFAIFILFIIGLRVVLNG